MSKLTLTAPADTMRYIRENLDILGHDIAEMVRRLTHEEGRKGYRARGLESPLGIFGFPRETITIRIPAGRGASSITIRHDIGQIAIGVSLDNKINVRFHENQMIDMPEAVMASLIGKPFSTLLDLSQTSMASLGNARIHSVFPDSGHKATVYLDGEITSYDAKVFVDEFIARPASEDLK